MGQNVEELMFVYILKREIGYDSWLMALHLFLMLDYDNFCTKTDTSDKIKYSRIPKNTETQQENAKGNTKRPLK